jgi:hypothetical protein
MQWFPSVQAAPVPHRQLVGPQLLLRVGSQAGTQAVALLPQKLGNEVEWQWLPVSQHPFEQFIVSQTQAPAEQRWSVAHCAMLPHAHRPVGSQLSARPLPHMTHAPPSRPQCARLGIWQVPPTFTVQQPFGHEVLSQTHCPLLQC